MVKNGLKTVSPSSIPAISWIFRRCLGTMDTVATYANIEKIYLAMKKVINEKIPVCSIHFAFQSLVRMGMHELHPLYCRTQGRTTGSGGGATAAYMKSGMPVSVQPWRTEALSTIIMAFGLKLSRLMRKSSTALLCRLCRL